MFKKVNAFSFKRLYINFNKENEKFFPVDNDGYKVLEGYGTESMSNFAVTESGNYIGGYFMDICTDDMNSPATGFFLQTKNKILFNNEELKENVRKQITENDEILILGEDYNCLLYPVIEDEMEYYIEYNKEDNSVGIIGTYNGVVKAEGRIATKFGCAFSRDRDFIKDSADVKYFALCSINRIVGYGG